MTPEQQTLADAVAAELKLVPAQGFDGHCRDARGPLRTIMRTPRINPRPGDRLAKLLTNRAGVTGVFSRRVLALEKRYPHSTTVVWTRKRPDRPCRSTLIEWRAWAKHAIVAAE